MRSVPVMEWNFNTPSEWDWENLSVYSGRASEIPKQGQISNNETEGNVVVDNGSIYSSGSGGFSGLGHGSWHTSSVSASVNSSSRERTNAYKDIDDVPKDASEKDEFPWMSKNGTFPEMVEASVVSAEPMVGLKLGTLSNKTKSFSETHTSSSSSQLKRSRASYQSTSPRCQVEGCSLDLVSAKDYHRRHRICESHSKSPKVIVAGVERRFCQQCSRFHGLSEFDDKKRSCRRRLSDHNARRRRPQTEGIRFGSTPLSSSIYDRRSQMNFFVNKFHIPDPNPTWESGGFKVTLAGESLFSLSKGGGVYKKSHSSSDVMPSSISTLNLGSERDTLFQGLTPQVLNHGLLESRVTSSSVIEPEARRAFSLLSTSSWGLNEPESVSVDQFGHENDISLAQPGMPSQLLNWELLPSEYVRIEQTPSQPRSDKLDLQNNGITQLQDIHSFKAAHESPCFYSNQIN